jgi:hypothetical protein
MSDDTIIEPDWFAKARLWDRFCEEQGVLSDAVPLFATDAEGGVLSAPYGKDRRLLLQRSPQIDALIIQEVEKVLEDFRLKGSQYEGLIYLMFWQEADRALPLYIGKSEKFGRGGGHLFANIASIRTNGGKFCRWEYNYSYHLGDPSAMVCPGHTPERATEKYHRWAERLFEEVPELPVEPPRLRREVWFWGKAWKKGDVGIWSVGIWSEYGATSLTFLEYLLIGVASDLFGQYLLNSEGVNRG